MSDPSSKYAQRGVSASKEDVHAAVELLEKGLFPNAFCKILPDPFRPDHAMIMHADTAGTKSILAYLYWKETNNLDIWKGIVQDALVMNLDDMACAGCTNHFVVSSTISRNKAYIPGEVIQALIQGAQSFIDTLSGFGIDIHHAGGETADVGDLVRTVDVGYTAMSSLPLKEICTNHIQDGDVIIGLASDGQTVYESSWNYGIGCNGLTSARHDLCSSYYRLMYPESFEPGLPKEVTYCGNYRLTNQYTDQQGNQTDIGSMVLSPTRTYLPLIHAIWPKFQKQIHGMIHCTGGGTTKVKRFLKGVRALKDNPLPIPELFQLIQKESDTSWKEMFQVFNMGTRLEIYTHPEVAGEIQEKASQLGIRNQIIGRVEKSNRSEVILSTSTGTISY